LAVRGSIAALPLFGRTETWTRYHGSIGNDCQMQG